VRTQEEENEEEQEEREEREREGMTTKMRVNVKPGD
jgi:hypothetical protein